MVHIHNYSEVAATLQNECIDSEIKISPEGREYQKLSGDRILDRWQRVALLVKAIACTLVTVGIGLFFKSVQQMYVDAIRGRKKESYYIYKVEITKLKLDANKPLANVDKPLVKINEEAADANKPHAVFPKTPKPKLIEVRNEESIAALKGVKTLRNKVSNSDVELSPKPLSQNLEATVKAKFATLKQKAPSEDVAGKVNYVVPHLVFPKTLKAEKVGTPKAVPEGPELNVEEERHLLIEMIEKDVLAVHQASDVMKKDPVVLYALAIKLGISKQYPNIFNMLAELQEWMIPTLFAVADQLAKNPSQNLLVDWKAENIPGYFQASDGFITLLGPEPLALLKTLVSENLIAIEDLGEYRDGFLQNGLRAICENKNPQVFINNLKTMLPLTPDARKRLLGTIICIGYDIEKYKNVERVRDEHIKWSPDNFAYIVTKDLDVYIQGYKLGEGTYKVVYTATNCFGSEEVVWIESEDYLPANPQKNAGGHVMITETNCYKVADGEKEEETLKRLHDAGIPHIPPLYKAAIKLHNANTNTMSFVRIQKRFKVAEELYKTVFKGGKVNPRGILKIAIHVAKALSAFHNKGWVHCDVKPDNILFEEDAKGEIIGGLLTDFGLEADIGKTLIGTPMFLPPESIAEERGYFIYKGTADPSVDSFALGVSLVNLITGSDAEMGNNLPPNPIPEKKKNLSLYFNAPDARLIQRDLMLKKNIINDNALLDKEEKRICNEILDICKKLMQVNTSRISCTDAIPLLEKIKV